MTIDSIASIQLSGNLPNVVIHATEETTVTLQEAGGEPFMTHRYQPDGNGRIEINLRDIIEPRLTFHLQDSDTPYRQTDIVKQFTLTATMDEETDTQSFNVLRAGIDNLADSVDNFLTGNFLTWQPNCKPVTYYTPEFLTYYAVSAATIKCTAHKETGDVTVTLATIPAGQCWTVPVQYGIIAGKVGGYPLYYDVWAEVGGSRATYIQRYYASDMKSEEEQWVLFENSLGGIDCFRAYGDSENTAEHTHNVAEIEEDSEEYRVDTQRKYKKNTGHLGKHERLWLLDFFPSLGKYIYTGSYIRKIVVVDSDVSYQAKELPSSYSFTYRFATARPYLNIPRADIPSGAIDIALPDQGSFTLAPRLAEFPRTQLSGGALLPVQSPYSDTWGSTTMAALLQYIASGLGYETEGGGFIPPGISEEEVRQLISVIGSQKFLSKEHADTAAGLITFLSGLTSNEVVTFVKGLVANGMISANEGITIGEFISGLYSGKGARIDELGNAEVESIRVRSFMEVVELIINRLSAIEGDQLLTEADTVESVQEIDTDSDGVNDGYRLFLKDKWDGYLTAQYEFNVLKGIINTLPGSQSGYSDVTEADSVETSGANRYYTSWMYIIGNGVHAASGNNYIDVKLYPDGQVPAGRNFPPCAMMKIARWGNAGVTEADESDDADTRSRKEQYRRRQSCLYLSSTGEIVKLSHVTKPKLEIYNYGFNLGELPAAIKQQLEGRIVEGEDYLWARGVVVQDFIQLDKQGKPIIHYIRYGVWDPLGRYHFESLNDTGIYETSLVGHLGCVWQCLVDGTHQEPKWNATDWMIVEGNTRLSMRFYDTDGVPYGDTLAVRPASVNVPLVPHVFYGYTDITDDLPDSAFSWTRDSQSEPLDSAWAESHAGQRSLTITTADLPSGWWNLPKLSFTCTAIAGDQPVEQSANII